MIFWRGGGALQLVDPALADDLVDQPGAGDLVAGDDLALVIVQILAHDVVAALLRGVDAIRLVLIRALFLCHAIQPCCAGRHSACQR